MRSNRAAFQTFLKFGSSRKSGVTGVTGVTANENNSLARHTPENKSVTGVTDIAGDFLTSSDMDERQAMAEIEGGVPALYSAGFARLQLTPPPGLSIPQWLQTVDDAGRLLDAFGQQAQAMGWREGDLFRPDGLVRMLQGAHVVTITATMAALSDGRLFRRAGADEK